MNTAEAFPLHTTGSRHNFPKFGRFRLQRYAVQN
jgi:hypothetical protein